MKVGPRLSIRRHAWVAAASGLLLGASPRVFADLLTVNQWSLSVGVGSTFPNIDSDTIHALANPLQTFHQAMLPGPPPSSAQASYDFAWSGDSGSFSVTAANAAADTSGSLLRSISSGVIRLTPTVDTLVTVSGDYHFDLTANPGDMSSEFGVAVLDSQSGQTLLSTLQVADPTFGDPAFGTFMLQDQTVMPAGCLCWLTYNMRVSTFGTSGTVALGDGDVTFSLAPVPEPGAALLIAVGFMLVRPRRMGRTRGL